MAVGLAGAADAILKPGTAPKDLYTKRIVGYAFSDRIDTPLTLAALDMAYRRRRPDKGLIFHSNQGVQYAAKVYRERLETYGIRQNMSGRGNPYDNAVAENFFSCLKCELIHLKQYETQIQSLIFFLQLLDLLLGPYTLQSRPLELFHLPNGNAPDGPCKRFLELYGIHPYPFFLHGLQHLHRLLQGQFLLLQNGDLLIGCHQLPLTTSSRQATAQADDLKLMGLGKLGKGLLLPVHPGTPPCHIPVHRLTKSVMK